MHIYAKDRRGGIVHHTCSNLLTDDEVLERFGLKNNPFTVDVYPDGRPDQTRRIQTFEENPDGNKVWRQ